MMSGTEHCTRPAIGEQFLECCRTVAWRQFPGTIHFLDHIIIKRAVAIACSKSSVYCGILRILIKESRIDMPGKANTGPSFNVNT